MFFVIIVIDYRIKGVDKMNFDLSWFTTIPGLFITGGVILLIIALVILIVTGRKTKKEKEALANDSQLNPNNIQAGGVAVNPAMSGVPGMSSPGMPMTPAVDANVVAPVNPMPAIGDSANVNPMPMEMPISTPEVSVPTVDPMMGNSVMQDVNVNPVASSEPTNIGSVVTEPAADPFSSAPAATEDVAVVNPIPTVDPMMGNSTMQDVNVNPMVTSEPANVGNVVTEPVVADPFSAAPVAMEDAAPVNPVPTVNQVMESSVMQDVNTSPMVAPITTEPVSVAPIATEPISTVQTMPEALEQSAVPIEPVIYGGANPTVSDINLNQEGTHQIYGGADPLQNTQPIPAIAPVTPVAPVSVEPQVTEPVMVAAETPQIVPVEAVAPVVTTAPEVAPVMANTVPVEQVQAQQVPTTPIQ